MPCQICRNYHHLRPAPIYPTATAALAVRSRYPRCLPIDDQHRAGLVCGYNRGGGNPEDDARQRAATRTTVGIDEQNAYGRFMRSVALEGAHKVAKPVAAAAAQWQCMGNAVWQRVNGSWRRSWASRGGWQGSPLVQIMFSCSQHLTMCEAFDAHRAEWPRDPPIARIAILDDQYVHGEASALLHLWPHVEAAKVRAGHILSVPKCNAFAAALDAVDDDNLPPSVAALLALIPRARYALPMLGSAATGDVKVHIAADQIFTQAANERSERACRLAKRVRDFCNAAVTPHAAMQAWFLLSIKVCKFGAHIRRAPRAFSGTAACRTAITR